VTGILQGATRTLATCALAISAVSAQATAPSEPVREYVIGIAGGMGMVVRLAEVQREGNIATIPVLVLADTMFVLDDGTRAPTRMDVYVVNCAASRAVEVGSQYFDDNGRMIRDETSELLQMLPPADGWAPIPPGSALATIGSAGCLPNQFSAASRQHRVMLLGERDNRTMRVYPGELDVVEGDTVILMRQVERDLEIRYDRVSFEERNGRRSTVFMPGNTTPGVGRGSTLIWIVPGMVFPEGALVLRTRDGAGLALRIRRRTP
jgi:hypothetical protein